MLILLKCLSCYPVEHESYSLLFLEMRADSIVGNSGLMIFGLRGNATGL